jgi:hypothetical protein
MDKELKDIREYFDMMMPRMQQETCGSWRYERPMKKKTKWPVQ